MRVAEQFFGKDVLEAAPALLGKLLCRRMPDGQIRRIRITETEAYRGEEDGACHARFGKTTRNEIMYRTGGYAYVYMIYGLHHMMNVVTGMEGEPQAVLIRAAQKPLDGPARLTKALHIDRTQNGLWLPDSDVLWIEDDDCTCTFETAPRVGIQYAPTYWRDIPWRFIARDIKEDLP